MNVTNAMPHLLRVLMIVVEVAVAEVAVVLTEEEEEGVGNRTIIEGGVRGYGEGRVGR